MRKTASSMRRRVLMLAIAAIGIVALSGTALAGHMTGDVKSYTGCLVPKDGVIIKVKEGNSPASACTGGSTQVHLSGGDITRISVTGALTGGGDNGEITIGLKPEFTLPDCEQFDFPVKTGSSNWACATHDVGTGLGVDKELGPTSGTVSYRLLPAYRIPGKACATAGQFARGFDNDGNIQCATPPSAQGEARSVRVPSHTFAGPGFERLADVTLSEGVWMLTARVDFAWRGGTDDFTVFVACELRTGASVLAGAQDERWNHDTGSSFAPVPRGRATLTAIDVESAPAAGKEVGLWCRNAGGTVGSLGDYGADLVAVKVS
jgi:hypothetical protein